MIARALTGETVVGNSAGGTYVMRADPADIGKLRMRNVNVRAKSRAYGEA